MKRLHTTLSLALLLAAAAAIADAPEKKKIAMFPYKTSQASYTLGTSALRADRLSLDLRDEFNKYFTQSRRFTVLSRQDDAVVEGEEHRIVQGNYRDEELNKLGEKLGCDVLVTGEIKEFYIAAPRTHVIAASGRSFQVVDRAVFGLTYRMVDLTTGEILDTDNLVIDLTPEEIAQAACDPLTIYRMLMTGAVLEMAKIIDPAKIVKHLANGDYAINQGGSLMVVGSYLDAYAVGESIEDPDTGEVLGSEEELLGIVQIIRVDKKLSYAKLHSGAISEDAIANGVIVRAHRITDEERAAAAKAAAEQAAQQSETGVKLPFDR